MNTQQSELYNKLWVDWTGIKLYGPASRWRLALILRMLRHLSELPVPVASVLDVGCGEGTTTYAISRLLKTATVTGVDISSVSIDMANRMYRGSNLKYVVEPEMQALSERYDLVSCFEVLEHVPQWEDLFGKLARASAKYLLISCPTGKMRNYESQVGHLRTFRKYEIENFALKCGFKPVDVVYAGFPFFSPLYQIACDKLSVDGVISPATDMTVMKQWCANLVYFSFRYLSVQRTCGRQFCGLFVKCDVA